MAERETEVSHQHKAGTETDISVDKTQYIKLVHVSQEYKQEKANIALDVKQQDSESKNNIGETTEQPDDCDSAKEKGVPLTEESFPHEDSTPSQADDGSHGDYNRKTPKSEGQTKKADISSALPPEDREIKENKTYLKTSSPEEISEEEENKQMKLRKTVENICITTQETTEPTVPEITGILGETNKRLSAEDHTGDEKEPEAAASTTPSDREDDQVDGPKAKPNEDANTKAGGNREIQENTTYLKTSSPEEISEEEENKQMKLRKTVENICITTQETTEPTVPEITGILGETNKRLSAEDHTGDEKEPEAAASTTPSDREDDQVDGPKAKPNEDANTKAGGNREIQENTTSLKTSWPEEISEEEENKEKIKLRKIVENIGSTTQETTEPTVPEITGILGRSVGCLKAVGMVVVVAILVHHLLQPESPPPKNNVDVFLRQMENLKMQFPHQRAELWIRSRIHLQRHLQTAQPTAPVSLILTAGPRAERTLHCLAQGLASAFSSALNGSVLHIDGANKASEDSDQVKLDIDSKLQGAFEGDKPVAVIHRFEELPPGSTLIFYRYCDHENAAYKKTFLIFTVLLGHEKEIDAKMPLTDVEEMVDDHLQKKFITHGHPVSFDRMDLDKYSGLWSRISHLILPVATEERIEHKGC
ncbi:torsin-1A-interacting protein 2-like [Xiphias gladius]|uniref:torsin-1A-interacting protein 2-like n=1 Tax=Xiphias gladius TaxID=8245 RepID=UPI001A99B131|nr:torsin-1A-interacting protein 2-like [Xiphias gladius]